MASLIAATRSASTTGVRCTISSSLLMSRPDAVMFTVSPVAASPAVAGLLPSRAAGLAESVRRVLAVSEGRSPWPLIFSVITHLRRHAPLVAYRLLAGEL